ncbi:unnamed protein product [Vitrella brassicaformis CCMP3155]|uniref:peptidylprolyl isomerase n=3 Tax=Vitrella brassicaformis TaxID=1169539 RepID=A0A0G4FDM8_VITBC|nr:unnamed protein product [Vitrella brassicaformis CCMP3155]|eukprot:CEM11063.1 unnamed protein product [Vitrella brassicaformis CCMP3155]
MSRFSAVSTFTKICLFISFSEGRNGSAGVLLRRSGPVHDDMAAFIPAERSLLPSLLCRRPAVQRRGRRQVVVGCEAARGDRGHPSGQQQHDSHEDLSRRQHQRLIAGALSATLLPLSASPAPCAARDSNAPPSPSRPPFTRIEIEAPSAGPLGIELEETAEGIKVKQLVAGSEAANNPDIRPGLLLESVNGQSVQGLRLSDVKSLIRMRREMGEKEGEGTLRLAFRGEGGGRGERDAVSQGVADTIDKAKREGQVIIDRRKIPEVCSLKAKRGDLLELRYVGRLEDGKLIDSSRLDGRSVPGKGAGSSIYLLLGDKPPRKLIRKFQSGLYSMCEGEKRRITIPPSAAFGSEGLPEKAIPPDATLIYDVELVKITPMAGVT